MPGRTPGRSYSILMFFKQFEPLADDLIGGAVPTALEFVSNQTLDFGAQGDLHGFSQTIAYQKWQVTCRSVAWNLAGGLGGNFGLPAQDGLAGGGDFVEAADAGGVRRGLYQIRLGGGLLGDGTHGIDEEIAFLLGRSEERR